MQSRVVPIVSSYVVPWQGRGTQREKVKSTSPTHKSHGGRELEGRRGPDKEVAAAFPSAARPAAPEFQAMKYQWIARALRA